MGEWEHKGKFLRKHHRQTEETLSFLPNLAGKEKEWAEASAKALENTIPQPIPYEELDINMGERWIDTKLYADFASDLFGVGAT